MNVRVQDVIDRISERIQRWTTVEALLLAEGSAERVFDPYLTISLDVYYERTIPLADDRREYFTDSVAFESSAMQNKDRFLLDDIPVRLEYKDRSHTEELVRHYEDYLWAFREVGTYPFYRLQSGRVLYTQSEWVELMRAELTRLPEEFWRLLRGCFEAAMEHLLADLAAAAYREDLYFYTVSAAAFIRRVCNVLFLVNRSFEPSARQIARAVMELPVLPESFRGRFDSFLRESPELDPGRKHEVAELLAKSVLAL
jgi:hypothetical protein